jgi:hypothetical protein
MVETKKGRYCAPCYDQATDIYDPVNFDPELYAEFAESMDRLTTPDLPPMHSTARSWPLPNPLDNKGI